MQNSEWSRSRQPLRNSLLDPDREAVSGDLPAANQHCPFRADIAPALVAQFRQSFVVRQCAVVLGGVAHDEQPHGDVQPQNLGVESAPVGARLAISSSPKLPRRLRGISTGSSPNSAWIVLQMRP